MKLTNLFINPNSYSFIWKTDTNYDFSFILYLLRILLDIIICIFKDIISLVCAYILCQEKLFLCYLLMVLWTVGCPHYVDHTWLAQYFQLFISCYFVIQEENLL